MKKIILDQNIINEIIRLYNEEMLGSPTISEKIGIHKTVIIRILKENGVDVGIPGRKFKGGKSESDKRYYKNNKEKRLKYFSEWQKENYDYRKEYMKEYREKNADKIREVKRTYERTRKANDPLYKLISNFRTAIYQVLKENNVDKNGHYFEILKYSPDELISHLENQFKDGMTWDNYGEWHVDHIKAISLHNIKEIGDEEFMKCWSLDNLQPMWGKENIRKSNKIIVHQ
jgi:hypothetical protein